MVSNPFSEGLSVKVTGDTVDAQRALGRVQRSLISTRKLALGLGGVLAGALAVKGLGSAVSAAASFEEAMVEVQKVTDPETAEELAGRMRDLATEIPVTADELAGLAADAARFGIRGTDNIEAFTTTVAKMATATDLSTQEAGEAFAKLSALTGTPVDQMENLGSAVNELSNTMATSSSEIVDSMLRGSAALSQFGLNQTQIAGMSAALNEVSESSQRAGTRLKRVAQELMNPKNVADVSDALGMTTEEFGAMRDEEPQELILQMAEAFAEGGDTADALRETLSTASRQAIAGLAQNLDGLRRALDTSKRSFEDGTSVQEEFDAATQTFNSQLKILKNNIHDVAIGLGNELLPVLTPLIKRFAEFIRETSEGTDSFREFLDQVISQAVQWIKGPGMETMKTVVGAIVTGFKNLFGTAENEGILTEFINFIGDILTGVNEWLNGAGAEAVGGTLGEVFQVMADWLDRNVDTIKQRIIEPILGVLAGVFDALTLALQSEGASELGTAIGETAVEMMGFLADKMIEYAQSPGFRDDLRGLGGAVTNAVGAVLLSALETGPAIGATSNFQAAPQGRTTAIGRTLRGLGIDAPRAREDPRIVVNIEGDSDLVRSVSVDVVESEFTNRERRSTRTANRTGAI